MKEKHVLPLYLIFSFLAAVLVIFFVGTAPSDSIPISYLEKVGIAILFILCCIVGISFTFRPNWLRHYFIRPRDEEKNSRGQIIKSFQGHHPVCPTFQTHTIHWKEKTWCAGCLGLFIGLCGAILFMFVYMSINFVLTKMTSFLLLFLGLSILAIVYVESLYRSRYTLIHVFLTSLLPLGFCVMTIAVGTFVYGFFTILLCVLWLDTRIQLSKWSHRSLCTNCPESCKMFTPSV